MRQGDRHSMSPAGWIHRAQHIATGERKAGKIQQPIKAVAGDCRPADSIAAPQLAEVKDEGVRGRRRRR